jgi:hypothetical protein
MSLSKERLEKYVKLREERLELDRRSAAIKNEEEVIAGEIKEFMQKKLAKIARHQGYLITLDEVAGSVAWKTEYIRDLGAEAATEISQNAPKRLQLSVKAA